MNPSLKNWTKAYLQHYKNEEKSFPSSEIEEWLYQQLKESGLIWGVPIQLISSKPVFFDKWSPEEQYKIIVTDFIFLITHLFAKSDFSIDEIAIQCPLIFSSSKNIEQCIEKQSLAKNKQWLTHPNIWASLSIIYFYYHLENTIISDIYTIKYEICKVLIKAAISNNKIEKEEKEILLNYISSAQFSTKDEKKLLDQIQRQKVETIKLNILNSHKLIKYLTFDWISLIILIDHKIDKREQIFLEKYAEKFDLSSEYIDAQLISIQKTLTTHYKKLLPLQKKYSLQSIHKIVSNNLTFLLKKNLGMISQEIEESKELLYLLQRSTKQELNKKEKEKVKEQIYDILKTIPSLALFMAPGGSIILPILLKILPAKLLYPSSFTNEK